MKSSTTRSQQFEILTTPFTPLNHADPEYESCLATPFPSPENIRDCAPYDYLQQVAAQEHWIRHCMNNPDYNAQAQPYISVDGYSSTLSPPTFGTRQHSVATAPAYSGDIWSMYQPSMSLAATANPRPHKRARTHERTPSASTIASTGPASPYTANTVYPQIANTDYSPNSPAQAAYADQALFPKNLPTPSSTPVDSLYYPAYLANQFAQTGNAHWAMKHFANDYHNTPHDLIPEFYQSSRQSMSSHGRNSPATPRSGAADDTKPFVPSTDYTQINPNVHLFRTESSQAYQDELYNPHATYTSTPVSAPKRQPDLLTPHRNLINERLQTANLARTGSPASAVSRERSPFRDGSPLAPTVDWKPSQPMSTAAGMRQQQKEDAAQAEYAQHVPALRREPTKTISPKDAMLEYTEVEQPSLFQEAIPAGYRQYNGNTDAWQSGFAGQTGGSFGSLVANGANPHMQSFRQSAADASSEANFAFMQLPPSSQQDQASQIQGSPFQSASYAVPKMHYADATPEFPAQLTSMESSLSEGGPPASSQESYNATSAPQRPSDTRANTGTYTCTYHGCAQRFESHLSLQKHKREIHRTQPREATSDDNSGSDESPRSSESPVPAGMTSAAIQARNSQAGPHKCSRINPSTGKPCNTIFSRPYDLTRHEETIHNNRKHKVRCPMCREEKTFSRNDALTRHMRVVHPEVEAYGRRGRRAD